MSKRFISLFLAVLLLFGTMPPAAAVVNEYHGDSVDAWLESLEPFTEAIVNINSNPKNQLYALDTNAVNDPDAAVTPGVVLFALKAGWTIADLNRKLTGLGLGGVELLWQLSIPVWTIPTRILPITCGSTKWRRTASPAWTMMTTATSMISMVST